MIASNHGRYLTGWPDETLLKAIVGDAMAAADITTHGMPNYLRARRRGNYQIFTNYGPVAAQIPASITGQFCVGDRLVPPAGVAIMVSG